MTIGERGAGLSRYDRGGCPRHKPAARPQGGSCSITRPTIGFNPRRIAPWHPVTYLCAESETELLLLSQHATCVAASLLVFLLTTTPETALLCIHGFKRECFRTCMWVGGCACARGGVSARIIYTDVQTRIHTDNIRMHTDNTHTHTHTRTLTRCTHSIHMHHTHTPYTHHTHMHTHTHTQRHTHTRHTLTHHTHTHSHARTPRARAHTHIQSYTHHTTPHHTHTLTHT